MGNETNGFCFASLFFLSYPTRLISNDFHTTFFFKEKKRNPSIFSITVYVIRGLLKAVEHKIANISCYETYCGI